MTHWICDGFVPVRGCDLVQMKIGDLVSGVSVVRTFGTTHGVN
jgi:hypothetical protein